MNLREYLCVILVCALVFSGCTTVKMRYRRGAGETADLKVACYWRDLSGQRHFIGGLSVAVIPVGFQSGEFPEAVTSHAQPLFIRDLTPGKYRLIISDDTKEYVSETIRLQPGRELGVRVKAHGRTAQKVAINVAEGLGQAFVVVATAAVILGIIYLELELEDHEIGRHRH